MSTAANPVTSQPGQILMIAPGGEAAYVPQDQVASYQAKGAQIGVRMTAPDGKQKAIVPFNQQDAYQKKGATWDVSPDNDAVNAYVNSQQDRRSYLQIAVDNSPSGADPQNPGNPTQQGLNQMSPEGRASAQKQLAVTAGATAGGTALAASDLGALASEYAEYGGEVAKDAIGKIPGLLKSAWDWTQANPVKAYLLYKALAASGVGPSGIRKVLHIASGSEIEK